MENEFGNTGKMLRAGGMKPAPPGLDGLIMGKIIALERRRAYRRLAFLIGAKILTISFILFSLGAAIWKTIPDLREGVEIKQLPVVLDQLLLRVSTYSIYIIPIIVLLILGRIIAPKLER